MITMRHLSIFFAVVTVALLMYAFKEKNASGISGRTSPVDAVEVVYAIQGKDSLKTVPANGAFMLEAKAGMYKVIVDAKQPFKDVMLESVEVTENNTTDLGEIKIVQ